MSRSAAVWTRERGSSRLLAVVGRYATTAAVGGATFWLAYDGGTFTLTSRNTLALALWWTILVAVTVGLWPASRPTALAAATGVALASFALVTLASAWWAASAENAVVEFDRVALFLGVFLVAVLAFRRGQAAQVADGLALGIVATGVLALGSRCYPNVFHGDDALRFLPSASQRLSYPLDYWNGLAIFCGLAFPLALRAAVAGGQPLTRALALAPLPALAAVIYLTSSRGGVAVAGIGTVLFVLLTRERVAAILAVALVGAGSAWAVFVLHARAELVNDPGTAAATSQGRPAGALIALGCVAAGLLWFAATRLAGRALRPGPRVERIAAVAFVAVLLAGIVAAHPVRRFDSFKQYAGPAAAAPSGSKDFTQSHLLSGSGTGRWQQWTGAIDEWRTKPLIGRGAGSFGAWWAQHGTLPGFITDAHSLYAETLGELGILGFMFLIATFGAGLLSVVLRLRLTTGSDRTTVAALGATLVAYMVGAGVDWMWEMTVVAVVAFVVLGLLTGPATLAADAADTAPVRRGLWRLTPVAAVAVSVGVLYSQAVPVLADLRLRSSEAAVERGDVAAAAKKAADAHNVEPWAATPYLQMALVAEQAGRLGEAQRWIREAIRRDRTNWRLWLVQARLQTKRGFVDAAVRSLNRAAELNPRSSLFASLPARS